jgi:thiol-disulfide isomerase/thioredoxin
MGAGYSTHRVENRINLPDEFKRKRGSYLRETMSHFPSARKLILLGCFSLLPAAVFAKRVPDPAFKTLDGQSHRISAFRGQVVVVNFWATWCGPCQEELPRLSQIAASYAGRPINFIFISIDTPKDRSKIPAALARLHVDFTSWVGADIDTLDSFGLGNIVPGTIILDKSGAPIARIMGEAKEDDVRKPVDWLLDGRKGTPPAALTKRY